MSDDCILYTTVRVQCSKASQNLQPSCDLTSVIFHSLFRSSSFFSFPLHSLTTFVLCTYVIFYSYVRDITTVVFHGRYNIWKRCVHSGKTLRNETILARYKIIQTRLKFCLMTTHEVGKIDRRDMQTA